MLRLQSARSQLGFQPRLACAKPITITRSRRRGLNVCCQSKNSERGPEATQATAATVDAATLVADDEPDAVTCVANGMDGVTCYLEEDTAPAHPPVNASAHPHPLQGGILGMALLISPFAFWGTSMTVMKGMLGAVPPMLMGSFRLLPAGMVLVAWSMMQGRPQPWEAQKPWTAWAWVAAFALIDGAAFQGFLAEGLQRTPAGLGSVIIDSQPLTVAVLAALLFGEKLGPSAIAGLLLGVAGLLLLEVPEQYMMTMAGELTHLGSGGVGSIAHHVAEEVGGLETYVHQATALLTHPSAWLDSGEVWMLLAAQSMAVGTVMVRFVTKHTDAISATGWHMILGGMFLLGGALAADPHAIGQATTGIGMPEIAAALYVSLLGGAASYGIFFWQASSKDNLTALSSLTFLTPVFASASSYVMLGEVLTAPQLLGAAVTLSSVALINQAKPRPRSTGSVSSRDGAPSPPPPDMNQNGSQN